MADRSTKLWQNTGALANAVFASPARTVMGAVEKLKIVRLALGRGFDDGDISLNAYQSCEGEGWFASVLRDFERLSV